MNGVFAVCHFKPKESDVLKWKLLCHSTFISNKHSRFGVLTLLHFISLQVLLNIEQNVCFRQARRLAIPPHVNGISHELGRSRNTRFGIRQRYVRKRQRTPSERHRLSAVIQDVELIRTRNCKCDRTFFPCIPTMAPVATNENKSATANLKKEVFNPFYSPSIGDDGDDSYQYARYKVNRSTLYFYLIHSSCRPIVSQRSLRSPGNPCKKSK